MRRALDGKKSVALVQSGIAGSGALCPMVEIEPGWDCLEPADSFGSEADREPRGDVESETLVRRATRPWDRAAGTRGRPRKEPDGKKKAGCAWPTEERNDSTCGAQPVEGLALCPAHAKVLHQRSGKTCAWPNCEQTALFKPICCYHAKVALGLLDPYRS